jgi:hypothetical protein
MTNAPTVEKRISSVWAPKRSKVYLLLLLSCWQLPHEHVPHWGLAAPLLSLEPGGLLLAYSRPCRLIKIVLIQYLFSILSMQQTIQEIETNIRQEVFVESGCVCQIQCGMRVP